MPMSRTLSRATVGVGLLAVSSMGPAASFVPPSSPPSSPRALFAASWIQNLFDPNTASPSAATASAVADAKLRIKESM